MAGSGIVAGIVNPYAEGLMGIAQAQSLMSQIFDDVNLLSSLVQGSDSFQAFLSSPLVSDASKKDVLSRMLSENIHPYTLNFLKLLVDRKRIGFLGNVCNRYQELYRKLNQIALAEVSSTVPLTDGQQEAVKQKVVQITGAHSVELETTLDPDLIGGVVIKVGSQILDASLKGQLRRIGLSLGR